MNLPQDIGYDTGVEWCGIHVADLSGKMQARIGSLNEQFTALFHENFLQISIVVRIFESDIAMKETKIKIKNKEWEKWKSTTHLYSLSAPSRLLVRTLLSRCRRATDFWTNLQ